MGRTLAALLLLLTTTVGRGAVAAAPAGDRAERAAQGGGDTCHRLPPGKRLRLNLKPNTDLVDLIAWISAITCKQFILPGSIPTQGKTRTIISPQPITAAEAYDLFLDALDSVGLTVYPSHGVLRVIEASKAKSAPIPIYIDGED